MDDRRLDDLLHNLRRRADQGGWTPWQLVRRVYETARTPTLLMAWRLAAGLTQAELASSLRKLAADSGNPCGPSTPSCQQISRWENGHDKPGTFYQALLARWYRTDAVRLGFVEDVRLIIGDYALPATADRQAADHEENVAAATSVLSQLDQIRRRMDADLRHELPVADADKWVQIADQYVAAYGMVPPTELLERLAPDLADLAELVGQYPQQRDLTRLAARLCGLTGALNTDLGNNRAARDWLHTAGRYAAMSGDAATGYWVAMAQAMIAMYPLLPKQVLAIVSETTAKLGPHLCAGAAQLTGLAARAHGALSNAAAARAELGAAEALATGLSADQTNEDFFGFPRRAMLMYTSQVLMAIDDPAASAALDEALSCYPDNDPIDRPLILLDQARHLARHGHAEEAGEIVVTTITKLDPAWRVPLLATEARSVSKAISATSAQTGRRLSNILRDLDAS